MANEGEALQASYFCQINILLFYLDIATLICRKNTNILEMASE